MRLLTITCFLVIVSGTLSGQDRPADPIHIGSRLELLLDHAVIESLAGKARLQLHRPQPREVVFRTDALWEGNASTYLSVFRDGDTYRMYYRGGHYPPGRMPPHSNETDSWVLCYAESRDGLSWERPVLGLREWRGSTRNNIVLDSSMLEPFAGSPASTSVFVDRNPACPQDERIKIIVRGFKPPGLYVLGSADGLDFRVLSPNPIQTTGAFDSQNVVFWDESRGEYRMYHRGFRGELRSIYTATSKDILSFPEPEWVKYPGSPTMALYTNQIQPYDRAPHIFMGFPMRYSDRGWSGPMLELPGRDARIVRAESSPRHGTTITDGVFMSSRDGMKFKRWSEAFVRPGPRRSDSWVYGDNFIARGMVETASIYGDAPNDLSFYTVEGYWEGRYTSIRRHVLRVDGFVSASAPYAGGEVLTRPLVFEGGSLALNLETSAFGSLQVEVRDVNGAPIDGYSMDDCEPIFCDRLRHIVRWQRTGSDLRPLEGKTVRLAFSLKDADLYAFQFVPYEPDPVYSSLPSSGYMLRKSDRKTPFLIIDEDFSGSKAGVFPSKQDLDPVGKGRSALNILEGKAARVQVLRDDPVGSGKAGANHHLKIERLMERPEKGGRAWVRLALQDAADTTNGIVEVDARILAPSTNQSAASIAAFDNPPGDYSTRSFQIRFHPDGSIRYWRDQEVNIEGLDYEPDSWTEVHIRADLRKSVFDLTVNGKTAKNLPFGSPDVHRIQSILFAPHANQATLFVDRMKIRVTP